MAKKKEANTIRNSDYKVATILLNVDVISRSGFCHYHRSTTRIHRIHWHNIKKIIGNLQFYSTIITNTFATRQDLEPTYLATFVKPNRGLDCQGIKRKTTTTTTKTHIAKANVSVDVQRQLTLCCLCARVLHTNSPLNFCMFLSVGLSVFV